MNADQPNSIIMGFTPDQASRLSGVSIRQLGYWRSDGFFEPSLALIGAGAKPQRLYSFRDIVSLKIIHQLRNEARITLSHLREVKEKLAHLGDDLWAKTTLFVLNRRVVFHNPATGTMEDAANGQGVLQIPLKIVSGNMEQAVTELRRRDASLHGRIDTRLRGRKDPVIAGTRIPVRAIQEFAEAGYSIAAIMREYPTISKEDIGAALEYKKVA